MIGSNIPHSDLLIEDPNSVTKVKDPEPEPGFVGTCFKVDISIVLPHCYLLCSSLVHTELRLRYNKRKNLLPAPNIHYDVRYRRYLL